MHHSATQSQPTVSSSYTLGFIPSESSILQQCHSNLSSLDVISQPHLLKVCVKLVGEPTHAHPVHRALKVVRQTRPDGRRKALRYRLTSQLLISSSKISLRLCNLGLKVSNNLGKVNWL